MAKTHIDHIGIIVADLDRAIEKLAVLFGPPVVRKTLDDVGLRIAEFETANVTVEAIQYLGRNDAFARAVMGERLGLNHVSARVDDIDDAVRALGAAGFAVMQGFPRQGAHGRVAFFAPDADSGLLFEICAPDDAAGAIG